MTRRCEGAGDLAFTAVVETSGTSPILLSFKWTGCPGTTGWRSWGGATVGTRREVANRRTLPSVRDPPGPTGAVRRSDDASKRMRHPAGGQAPIPARLGTTILPLMPQPGTSPQMSRDEVVESGPTAPQALKRWAAELAWSWCQARITSRLPDAESARQIDLVAHPRRTVPPLRGQYRAPLE